MKLFRFGAPGAEKPGVLLGDDQYVDVSAFGEDYDEAFFGSDGPARLSAWLSGDGADAPRMTSIERYASAVCRPSKIICIGLNYAKHCEETGADIPSEPVIFFKASSSLAGPNDDLPLPRGSEKTDYEVELGFVIGKAATYVEEANALDHVAGYVLHNDYSERAYQLDMGGQWVKGKSCDGFAPLGPFLVTPDEIDDVGKLGLWLTVNGEERQRSNTDDLIFGIPALVSYLSRFMTLLPGDVVSTGTPFGVGLGFDPPKYLKVGDEVECGIDGLGTMRQRIVESR